jgi:hypothetical protein
METTTTRAAAIRAEYKRLGWTPRMVSVRSEYFSGGSSIRVLVKDPEVDFAEAERVLKAEERIRRCETTGEILSGGNTYTSIEHSPECRAALAIPILPAVRRAWNELTARERETSTELIPIARTGFWLAADNYSGLGLWGDGHHVQSFAKHESALADVAYRIAVLTGTPKGEGASR